jgi:hypothetical protein
MSQQEDDTHDKLTKAYLDYFKNNELFAKKKSKIPKIDARRALGTIRILARKRRKELHDEYHKAKNDRKLLKTINNGKQE